MIVDYLAQFSNAQSVALDGTSDLSTSSIDFGSAGTMYNGGTAPFAPGRGQPIRVVVRVSTALSGGTSIKAELVQADDAALSSNLVVLATSAVTTVATAVEGYTLLDIELPPTVSKRYVGVRYTTVGTVTAGKCDAFLVEASESRPGYFP